jgi:hypothetical protein
MTFADLRFDHLAHLTDGTGLFEHADRAEPRLEHGYCVDDVARGLVVTSREVQPDAEVQALSEVYLRFVIAAQVPDGRFHNRRGVRGGWQDEPTVEDCWGRALWGLGTAVARCEPLSTRALDAFDRSVRQRSLWTRSMVFASLGAAEVLTVLPDHRAARSLLRGAALRVSTRRHAVWTWPEPRLRYANAALAETMLAAGSLLDEPAWVHEGLTMLRWLVDVETSGDHLSPTPVGGWAQGEPRPGFDQQPIEIAALADASARAFGLTGDREWSIVLQQCADWFTGANDVGIAMVDVESGAGYDGLESTGRNDNRGAESTLAALSTMQQALRLVVVP